MITSHSQHWTTETLRSCIVVFISTKTIWSITIYRQRSIFWHPVLCVVVRHVVCHTVHSVRLLGSTSFPARRDTQVLRESFSWLTSVGTTLNTVIRLGWSRISLAVLILNAAGAGLISRPAVISGRYNKCHSLQQQNHHFPPLQHTFMQNTTMRHWSWEMIIGFEALYAALAGGILCDQVKRPIGQ